MINKQIDEVATWKNVDEFFKNEFQKVVILAKSPSAQGYKLAIEKVGCINSILNRMPKDERTVIYYAYFKNMKPRDSCMSLGISDTTFFRRKRTGLVLFAELYPYKRLTVYKVKVSEK
ncbi:DUF1492 domain-containing protein [Liquorilactobacillus hordei]|uniref:DUF1492 domain-containing protein n=1 Tax=Liquorilactobacillus hordei TaxID=468911 RepID=UPI001CBF81DE|nr:DUF1492 domain-containing protein [Liquorilactobacillus hordei]MBZ2406130.1 hypothetical protein [Liquorilactobacillus hordei]